MTDPVDDTDDGFHVITVTYESDAYVSGRVVERRRCDCDWCEIWRATKLSRDEAMRRLDAYVLGDS